MCRNKNNKNKQINRKQKPFRLSLLWPLVFAEIRGSPTRRRRLWPSTSASIATPSPVWRSLASLAPLESIGSSRIQSDPVGSSRIQSDPVGSTQNRVVGRFHLLKGTDLCSFLPVLKLGSVSLLGFLLSFLPGGEKATGSLRIGSSTKRPGNGDAPPFCGLRETKVKKVQETGWVFFSWYPFKGNRLMFGLSSFETNPSSPYIVPPSLRFSWSMTLRSLLPWSMTLRSLQSWV